MLVKGLSLLGMIIIQDYQTEDSGEVIKADFTQNDPIFYNL